MAELISTAKLLLIVEDDDTARDCLYTLLLEAGYEVAQAANGQEALDVLRNGPIPDLILLDMLMPVLDGWRLARQLKALPYLASVPVIVVTGSILTREWALAHGCAGLLHKPVEPELLLEQIEQCLA